MTDSIILNSVQSQQIVQTQQAIIDSAQVGAIRANQFVFLANFDGTNNSLIPSNGDVQNTNEVFFNLQHVALTS